MLILATGTAGRIDQRTILLLAANCSCHNHVFELLHQKLIMVLKSEIKHDDSKRTVGLKPI